MSTLTEKILFVDDDENILVSLKRQLRKKANIFTALNGKEGLELIKSEGPFAVVVSDMRMPMMNGAAFLTEVKELSPNSVRILLTGQADLESAIEAVNRGQIFRFLTKPCPPAVMAEALVSAINNHRLINAEKELLEKTLFGTVKVLTEILSMTNPTIFSQGVRVKQYVTFLINKLDLADNWDLQIAAMLSSLGYINISEKVLDKLLTGTPLSVEEEIARAESQQMIMGLLRNIPRFDSVAKMLETEDSDFRLRTMVRHLNEEDRCRLGRHIIKLARYVDQQVNSGKSLESVIKRLISNPRPFDATVVNALVGLADDNNDKVMYLKVSQLTTGMVLDEDILTPNDMVLLSKGHEITEPLLLKLIHFNEGSGVKEPIKVLINLPEDEVV